MSHAEDPRDPRDRSRRRPPGLPEMPDGHDALADVELDAWQPPAVPDGLADAVLRRVREPVAAAAREIDEASGGRSAGRARRDEPTPRSRRWRMAVGASALAAAVAAVVTVRAIAPDGGPRAPGPTPGPTVVVEPDAPPDGHGEVLAERATHLELGPSSAEVDAGAELRWRREGRRITVAQLRGAATWRIAAGDSLLLDAGAMGASVEASGASLRVEVHMEVSAGIRGVAAAAVAFATLVVYQGHADAASGGVAVRAAAGSAVELAAGQPPREVRAVASAPASRPALPVAGGSVSGDPAGAAGQVTAPSAAPPRTAPRPTQPRSGAPQPAAPSQSPAQPQSPPPADGASGNRRNVAPSQVEALRIKGNRNIMPSDFVKRAMDSAGDKRVIASFKMCIDVQGKVSDIVLLKTSGYPDYDTTIEREMWAWEFRPYQVDGKAAVVCTAVTFIYSQS